MMTHTAFTTAGLLLLLQFIIFIYFHYMSVGAYKSKKQTNNQTNKKTKFPFHVMCSVISFLFIFIYLFMFLQVTQIKGFAILYFIPID